MPQVEIDGLTINYDVQGKGEPLLLIPYTSADHACLAFQLAEHRFSRIFQGQGELIDHILISHALLARLVSVDADVTGLPSIGVNPNTRRDAPASDHGPLIALFT